MKQQIVFATNNPNKLAEIRNMLGDQIDVLGLADIDCREELPETSDTLEGNALQKARYVKANYGYDCFADDTGLEIDALEGRPGVYSARYAGPDCKAEDNMDKVLGELEGVGERNARFRTVIALIRGEEDHLFEGQVEGRILSERQGEKGFGYDPIFQPQGDSRSFAEFTMEEKNAISHRGRAVRKFIAFFSV